MDKVNVALIGAGGMANGVHYPSLASFDDVNLVGLSDLAPAKLNSTADRFGIENRFTNYKEMIEKTSPDAVHILMPPYHLFDLVIHALSQGIHVFIEKPPGISLHQIKSMALLAEKKGCKTMVGFNRRFIPLLQQVKGMVESKGQIIQAVSTFHKNSPAALYYNGAIDVLTCDAIHTVDALRWMAGGEVKKVASDVDSFYSERENCFNALVKFDNGCSGILMANWAVGTRIHVFEMHALGMSALVDPYINASATVLEGSSKKVITNTDAAKTDANHIVNGFYGENRHFIDCIKADKQPDTCFADAVKTMELVELIYRNQFD